MKKLACAFMSTLFVLQSCAVTAPRIYAQDVKKASKAVAEKGNQSSNTGFLSKCCFAAVGLVSAIYGVHRLSNYFMPKATSEAKPMDVPENLRSLSPKNVLCDADLTVPLEILEDQNKQSNGFDNSQADGRGDSCDYCDPSISNLLPEISENSQNLNSKKDFDEADSIMSSEISFDQDSQSEDSDDSQDDFDPPNSNSPLEEKIDEFNKFLKRCYCGFALPPNEVLQICEDARPLLADESSLLEISGPTIVVGDVHSNMGAVKYSCEAFLYKVQNGASILFLGDYVDRGELAPFGPNGVKCVAMILKLKTLFPDKVFILRGNHEDMRINQEDFLEEIFENYGEEDGMRVYHVINSIFDLLSLAAVIDKSTFCVHGGICEALKDINQIRSIAKPNLLKFKEGEIYSDLAFCLLWSDPLRRGSGFVQNTSRKAGCKYGCNVVKEFLEKNNLKRIIRAHQQVSGGFSDAFGCGMLITLFSAPKYARESDIGAILMVDGDKVGYCEIKY